MIRALYESYIVRVNVKDIPACQPQLKEESQGYQHTSCGAFIQRIVALKGQICNVDVRIVRLKEAIQSRQRLRSDLIEPFWVAACRVPSRLLSAWCCDSAADAPAKPSRPLPLGAAPPSALSVGVICAARPGVQKIWSGVAVLRLSYLPVHANTVLTMASSRGIV